MRQRLIEFRGRRDLTFGLAANQLHVRVAIADDVCERQ
jgi:hypothetical protein